MKKMSIVFFSFLLLGFVSATLKLSGQTSNVVADVAHLAWDYLDSDVTKWQVTKFQTSVDNGPFADVNGAVVTPVASMTNNTGETGPGKTYVYDLTALTVGNHNVALRACNVDVCSVPVSVDFHFTATPGAVLHLKISGK